MIKQTRAAILTAAEKLFAKKGFSGTSINDIADSIKINKSLIYHHFGSKEGLWKEVKLAIMAKSDEAYNFMALPTDQDLKSFLRQMIRDRFNFLNSNPNILRIINWQRLEPKQKKLRSRTQYAKVWRDALVELQNKGKIRQDLDPDMISLLLFSTLYGVFDEAVFAKDKAKQQQEYLDLVIETLYRSLRK